MSRLRLYLCHGPHCTVRGAPALRAKLESALWQADLLGEVEIISGSCQDHCGHGPNLLVQPEGLRYCGVNAARIAKIVAEHVAKGQPIEEWLATPEMRRSR